MLSVVVVLCATQAPTDELLSKLAAHDARLEAMLDAATVTQQVTAVELDSDGTPTHTTRSTFTLVRRDGKTHTTVVRSARDGEDEQAAATQRAAKTDEENKRTESPFAARNQAKYQFTQLAPDPKHPLLQRLAFKPKDAPSTDVLVGEALVDAQAGEVARLWLKPSKLPLLVDRLDMVLEFDAHTAAGRTLSKFTLKAEAGALFFKRRGDVSVLFSY